jgi:hypothetical protein
MNGQLAPEKSVGRAFARSHVLAFLCLTLVVGLPANLFATIPAAAKSDPRYGLGYLVVTYYPGVNTNGTGDCRAGIQEALNEVPRRL